MSAALLAFLVGSGAVVALGALGFLVRALKRRAIARAQRRAVAWWRSSSRTAAPERHPVYGEASPGALYAALWAHGGGPLARLAASRDSDVFAVLAARARASRVQSAGGQLPEVFDVRGGLGFGGKRSGRFGEHL